MRKWGRIYFQAHSGNYQQDSVPCALVDRGPQFFPAVGWKPPSIPRPLGLSRVQPPSWQLDPLRVNERVGEAVSEMEAVSHFCQVLFVRYKSVGPASTQEVNMPQGREHQQVGIAEERLRSFLPQPSTPGAVTFTSQEPRSRTDPTSHTWGPKSERKVKPRGKKKVNWFWLLCICRSSGSWLTLSNARQVE